MTLSLLEQYGFAPLFPSADHQAAMEAVVDYFARDSRVQAVILAGSCARGVAALQSCVDLTVLVPPEDLASYQQEGVDRLEQFMRADPACLALAQVVPWSAIDFAFASGEFAAQPHGWTTGPDDYELAIGNTLAWTHPLLLRGPRFEALQQAYLPYYDEPKRSERLAETIKYARNNLDHVVPYAERGLLGQAFKRLYHAMEEFLQALFIHRRIYPIAYDKWLHQQLVDILQEPALYDELLSIIALPAVTTRRLHDRARRLGALLDSFT